MNSRTVNEHVALSEPQQYDLEREREKRRDELANLFDECDLDGSGSIVLEELRIVLNGKGYTDHFVEVCAGFADACNSGRALSMRTT